MFVDIYEINYDSSTEIIVKTLNDDINLSRKRVAFVSAALDLTLEESATLCAIVYQAEEDQAVLNMTHYNIEPMIRHMSPLAIAETYSFMMSLGSPAWALELLQCSDSSFQILHPDLILEEEGWYDENKDKYVI